MDDLTTSSATTTYTTNSKKVQYSNSNNNSLYEYIDPLPVSPPSYDEVNWNRHVTFPIWEHIVPCDPDAKPPVYTPTIYKTTVASVKLEWLSPFDPSPQRGWRTYILELNSTQLNLYTLEPDYMKDVRNYHDNKLGEGAAKTTTRGFLLSTFAAKRSAVASASESKALAANRERPQEQFQKLAKKLDENKQSYCSATRLHKTYTLQYARMGIPVDYKKRANALRLRCETEQFMIKFANIDELMNWSMYLNMGMNVALDLDERQVPDYRVVPRRRRRHSGRHRGRRHRSATIGSNIRSTPTIFNRELFLVQPKGYDNVNTPQTAGTSSRMRSFTTTDLGNASPNRKLARTFTTEPKKTKVEAKKNNLRKFLDIFKSNKSKDSKKLAKPILLDNQLPNFNILDEEKNIPVQENPKSSKDFPSERCEEMLRKHVSILEQEMRSFHEASNLSDESDMPITPNSNEENDHATSDLQEPINEIRSQHVQDHDDDDDDEDDGEEFGLDDDDDDEAIEPEPVTSIYAEEGLLHVNENDYYYEQRRIARSRAASTVSANRGFYSETEDVKWMPPQKILSRKRYIKDNLRCIRSFVEHSSWMGKIVCCPVESPSFKTANSVSTKCEEKTVGNSRFRTFGTHCNDREFWRMKNHHLKLYMVTSNGYVEISREEALKKMKKPKSILC